MSEQSTEGYAYASCQGCRWKESTEGESTDLERVREHARMHAIAEGHACSITTITTTMYDFRVERPE